MVNVTSQITSELIKTEDFETFLNRSGEGNEETILFLHGSGPGVTSIANWHAALTDAGETFHCLAPDLYGFANSSHPDEPLKNRQQWMDQWVKQIIQLLDHLGVEKAHLVGNSLGCSVALELLIEYPERVNKVVLMGPGGTPNTKISYELARAKNFYDNPSKKKLQQIMSWFVYDAEKMWPTIEAVTDSRYENAMRPEVRRSNDSIFSTVAVPVPTVALNRIENEVLLVHGLNDKVCSIESSYYLLEHLKNAHLHVFGQCGHWTQLEEKDRFNHLIQEFFSNKL
ncbi:2-hydroxymuconate-semialdehyde hydrolase [Lysinibacillus composti]|uniref:Alpha/beta fold hydrolase n=1 Tax=Lysinibacillus composti TaxID=720633 RepID=A0A3N9UP79_9BACI|nr:alpha/beta hydrolase [Lysinibacillus composti]MBM7609390.1 2-hydroxymuconate-semialdehyde hydrolase [Lysinibacillus composti]RQW74332.1 alpha/beta fold hydrolase [Lysinibacillus composti]